MKSTNSAQQPEDGCPYADHRGMALYGYRIIVAHAPRTLAEIVIILEIAFLQLIEEIGSLHHLRTYLRFVFNIRSHHHQATDLNVLQFAPFATLQQFAAGIKRESVLRLFLCNMKFKQHLDYTVVLCSLLVDFLQ